MAFLGIFTDASWRWSKLACLALLLVFPGRATLAQQADAGFAARLAVLASGRQTAIGGRNIASSEFLVRLYAELGNTRAWTSERNIAALRDAVARSWEDGLMPSDFHSDALNKPTASPDEQDILMSDALIRLLYQLYFGKVYPNALDPNWNFARPLITQDPALSISKAIAGGKVAELIDEVRLKHPLYLALKATLQAYTQFEASGGWPVIPDGPS